MAGHQKPYGTQQPYATEAYPIEQPYAGPTAQGVTVVGSTVTAQPLSEGLVGHQHQQRAAAGALYSPSTPSAPLYDPSTPLYNSSTPLYNPTIHGRPPRTYCFLAWVSCLFCCWPVGLGAVIMSYSVTKKMRNNDFEGAHRASQMAKRLALAAIAIGIIAQVSGWTSYSETNYGNNRSGNLRSSSTSDPH